MILDMSSSSLYGGSGNTIGMGLLWTESGAQASTPPVVESLTVEYVGSGLANSGNLGFRKRKREFLQWNFGLIELFKKVRNYA